MSTFIADVRSWWQKFVDNVRRLWAYATAWVTTIWTAAFAYWGSLTSDERIALVGGYIAANKVPFIMAAGALVSFVVAKGWPQPKLTEKLKEDVHQSKVQALVEKGVNPNTGA